MRLVLDTNVLTAALISRGVCAELVQHCVLTHTIVTSDVILNELRAHLVGKFNYEEREADEAVSLLASQMEVATPATLEQPICRDTDDDQILATAVAGQSSCIITGDKDLLILRRYVGIEILSPGDFAGFESEPEHR
jgi:putative PIN family toxin of toxin-antitoxin system